MIFILLIKRSKYNERFCFNDLFLKEFQALGAEEWISPVISGLVLFNFPFMQGNAVNCDFILISRRDKSRTGMRFISRGSDQVWKIEKKLKKKLKTFIVIYRIKKKSIKEFNERID